LKLKSIARVNEMMIIPDESFENH